uniref:LIM zinc-binding domain-containing protein n=1 Tax=Strongyloides stercoralis TaxID=6248 RepID=A0A0K0DWE8_STRER
MPTQNGDQFVEAVRPALEALLSDLQLTTEVLRKASHRNQEDLQSMDRLESIQQSRSSSRQRINHDNDIDPIYQEQHIRETKSATPKHGLENLEQLLNDYSDKRKSKTDNDQRESSVTSNNKYGTLGNHYDDKNSSRQNLNSHHNVGQYNSMIGSLNSDINKHGVHTIPKGDCAGCDKPIIGQVVIALGKMWHPEHYVCCHCGEELGHRIFFERAGKAYCEHDYHELFSPRCAACQGPIKDRCVTAMGKTFHTEHFVCVECKGDFGAEGYHEKDGLPYCKTDFFRLYGPKCRGCRNPIQQNFITALGTHWHPGCFVCQDCSAPFTHGSFFDYNGVPYCEHHYHQHKGSLCSVCNGPILGRCVSAMGVKFHPEHFCCSYCNKQLSKGTFKEVSGKTFCQKCYEKTHPTLQYYN